MLPAQTRTPAPVEPAPAGVRPPLEIIRGTCAVVLAYDVGFAIDLEQAERRVLRSAQRETIRHKKRAPKYFAYDPPPLRVTQQAAPPPALDLAGFAMAEGVDCVLYDFGAAAVVYTIPIRGELGGLLALSDRLYENQPLLDDSRRRVEALVADLGPAVAKPEISAFVEDYVIYHVEEFAGEGQDLEGVIDASRDLLARVLRAEPRMLSSQEVSDALASRVSYSPTDAAIIDWNAAMLFQSDAEDVRAVLEFANVELLEMRRLDDRLDDVLEASHAALSRRRRFGFAASGADLRRIAELQMDSSLLFENVNNALKLLGDQYLARVYRHAAQRLHLPEWDASILRKLQTAESIYEKLSDRDAARRLEILEWIIIILIAVSILIVFIPL